MRRTLEGDLAPYVAAHFERRLGELDMFREDLRRDLLALRRRGGGF